MFLVLDFRKRKKIIRFFLFLIIFLFLIFLGFKLINYVFPIKYQDIIEKYSQKYGVEKSLVYAVINVESRFKEDAVSNKQAKGLMQIIPDTAIWIAEKAQIDGITQDNYFEAENNINLGVWYLSYFLTKYDDKSLALASYNAGRGNVLKWLDDERYSDDGETLHTIPFEETDNYIKKVFLLEKGYSVIFKLRDLFTIN